MKGIKEFKKKIYLSSPTMHGEEMKYIAEAYESNWMSTVGENINEVERIAAEKAEMKYAVGLSSCTAALHLAVKHAGETLYGKPAISHGALEGKRVFCSDMTFDATLNPVVYEGGIPVFIDTEAESWNMDPVALEKAFEMYPDVKLVVSAELYGFPGRMDLIKEICEKHGALLVEDAAEAMGATIHGKQCGSFGDYSAISYNGNKIITGSSGGCLLTNDIEVANKARKWSTQAREAAPWYQHEEVGYNYRMSNVIAGVIRGQYPHLEEHIAQKKAIYERYALKDSYSLVDVCIDASPHLELMRALNEHRDIKRTEYCQRYAVGTLDSRSRVALSPHTLRTFEEKFAHRKQEVLEGSYSPVQVYQLHGKYYIADGKHRAALCVLFEKPIKCSEISSDFLNDSFRKWIYRKMCKKRNVYSRNISLFEN